MPGIEVDNSDSTPIWNAAPTEALFIRTFAATYRGAYVPASAIKGAMQTGLVHSRWSTAAMEKIAGSLEGDRVPRRIAEAAEAQVDDAACIPGCKLINPMSIPMERRWWFNISPRCPVNQSAWFIFSDRAWRG